jgi:hypothetical protein
VTIAQSRDYIAEIERWRAEVAATLLRDWVSLVLHFRDATNRELTFGGGGRL